MQSPYFIASLPRSGTAWLANLLTFGDSLCLHEALANCDSVDWLKAILNSFEIKRVGDADPNLGLVAHEVFEAFPKSKFVIVCRSLGECLDAELVALEKEGLGYCDPSDMRRLLERASNGLEWLFKNLPRDRRMFVLYEDLYREATASAIWRFCGLQEPFPTQRFQLLRYLRVTQMMLKRSEDGAGAPFTRWLTRIGALNGGQP